MSYRDLAEIWGAIYQSESDPKKIESFIKHKDVQLVPGVLEGLEEALPSFKGDKGIKDQTKLRELLIATARHESLGGKYLEQIGGPARGAWQVEPETAIDIVKTSGLIGPSAERVLGFTKAMIIKMPDPPLGDFLKQHRVNATFAIAKYLQGADAKGMLNRLV